FLARRCPRYSVPSRADARHTSDGPLHSRDSARLPAYIPSRRRLNPSHKGRMLKREKGGPRRGYRLVPALWAQPPWLGGKHPAEEELHIPSRPTVRRSRLSLN